MRRYDAHQPSGLGEYTHRRRARLLTTPEHTLTVVLGQGSPVLGRGLHLLAIRCWPSVRTRSVGRPESRVSGPQVTDDNSSAESQQVAQFSRYGWVWMPVPVSSLSAPFQPVRPGSPPSCVSRAAAADTPEAEPSASNVAGWPRAARNQCSIRTGLADPPSLLSPTEQ